MHIGCNSCSGLVPYMHVCFHSGLLHFSYNPSCKPAAFLANFATKDPGTQTMWGAMMTIPTDMLHMATGIPESTIEQLKSYPIVTAPGTGGEACLKRCGMDFASVRLTNSPSTLKIVDPLRRATHFPGI